MDIAKILNQAQSTGSQKINDLTTDEAMERLATGWLTALVNTAQESPVEFVTRGASVPPWVVFDKSVEAFADANKETLSRRCNEQLKAAGSGHRVRVDGTCLVLS